MVAGDSHFISCFEKVREARTRSDLIILDYSKYSAPQNRMLGINSMYSECEKRLNGTDIRSYLICY